MKVELTPQEYRLLLDLVYLGEWMLYAFSRPEDTENTPHRLIEQKVYSYAREAGAAQWIEADAQANEYVPTARFEEEGGIREVIDRFIDESFWNELIDRLAERDLQRSQPSLPIDDLEPEELARRKAPYAKRYEEEFYQHGLMNLVLKDH